jgi:phosphatidate phosphatase APP1
MFKILFIFLFLISFNSVFAKVVVVSDIDDTIRQSHILNLLDAGIRLAGNPEEFKDLGVIYQALSEASMENSGEKMAIVYISASTKFFYLGEEWITLRQFPQGEVVQRQSLSEDKKMFKVSNIIRFLGENYVPGDELFLFGDNAELDPEIYQEVLKKTNLKGTIFIRDVRVKLGRYTVKKDTRYNRGADINYYTSGLELVMRPEFSVIKEKIKPQLLKLRADKKLLADFMVNQIRSEILSCSSQGTGRNYQRCIRKRKAMADAFINLVETQIVGEFK